MEQYAIQTQSLTKIYGRGFCALNNVCLNIRKGDIFGLVGRNGAGKTTLLQIIGSLTRPPSGRVTLGGVLLRLTDTAGLRDTADPVEAIGVNRALDAAADAALAIAVFDAAHPLDEDDRQVIDAAQAAQVRIAVLNKSDLPKLKLLDPPSTLKDKFHLKCINKQYKLYASVIKLSENEPLLNEYISSGAYLEKELKQMALVCTELDAQILWKQNIPVVMIKVLDRFIDSGNENLSEIRPFNAD